MDKEERKESKKGWVFGLSGLALLVKLALQAFGVEVPQDMLDQGVTFILSAMAAFGGFRNNYFGNLGKAQFRLLRNSDMQHFFKEFFKKKDN